MKYRFDRMEFAGSLGDLGTLLPLAAGMILVNGLSPLGIFFTIGAFYILAGIYYGVTTPVQPMKVIAAYAIAAGMSSDQIMASALLIGALLLLIGLTRTIDLIVRYIPKPVIRGVQLSTGVILMTQGVKFIIGTSKFQELNNAAEPFLDLQSVGPIPLGIIIGIAAAVLTFLLLDNKKFPAGILVVLGGMLLGLILGTGEGMGRIDPGLHLPEFFPFGLFTGADLSFALLAVVLPQIPMTLGNAVIADADLSMQYFGEQSRKVTPRALCVSMGLANLGVFLFGGMPVCHGAGGLAAHYRFGARTAGSNIIIGTLFLAMALILGSEMTAIIYLLPMSVLGILLVFAGTQLGLTILDMGGRKDLFVILLMLGITLAVNLAAGFLTGILVAYLLRSDKLTV